MRIIYPKEIDQEREALFPYMEFREGEGWVVKNDAPQDIKRRHILLLAKIEELRRRHR